MDRGVVFQRDALSLRQSRKLLHSVLHPRNLDDYDEELNTQVKQFLYNIMQTPESFISHIRQ